MDKEKKQEADVSVDLKGLINYENIFLSISSVNTNFI
jgi:hypothetical protein